MTHGFGDIWAPLEAALDAASAADRTVEIWLRDDDAVTVTPALVQLADLARRFDLPVLLAVIPAEADAALAALIAGEPLLEPTQHGFSHTNHARPGERACELGVDRPIAVVIEELARGRDRMRALFGRRARDVLVPPWNRIAQSVLPALPELGFRALSTFADAHAGAPAILVRNCDLDIIDWRRGRQCRPPDKLVARLAALVEMGGPVGLLTHHRVHDAAAWHFLEAALERLVAHPAIRFVSFDGIQATPRR